MKDKEDHKQHMYIWPIFPQRSKLTSTTWKKNSVNSEAAQRSVKSSFPTANAGVLQIKLQLLNTHLYFYTINLKILSQKQVLLFYEKNITKDHI